MSKIENGVSRDTTTTATDPTGTTNFTEDAQARLLDLRLMRDRIPFFVIPADATETSRLSQAASVPPEFVELTAVALTNEKSLVRVDEAASPAQMRIFMSYAEAFSPFADELEAFAKFVRHSVTAARNRAGRQALTTYALAQRLATQPETAHLAPYVADMRRALGRARKLTPEQVAQKEADRAAKAAAKAAEKAARKAAKLAAATAVKPQE